MPGPSPFNSARSLIGWYYDAEIRLDPRESTVTVGTTAVAIGKYANQRSAILLGNCGTTAIVVGFSASVTSGAGIPIAGGAWFSFNWFQDNEIVMRDMFAISSAGGQTLYVLESVLAPVN
jgi:hypothetical protein